MKNHVSDLLKRQKQEQSSYKDMNLYYKQFDQYNITNSNSQITGKNPLDFNNQGDMSPSRTNQAFHKPTTSLLEDSSSQQAQKTTC